MRIRRFMALAALVLFMGSAYAEQDAPTSKKICTWDPIGRQGPVMSFLADLKPASMGWGMNFELIPYQNESEAAQDLRDGKCDMAVITAIKTRDFVKFGGTLDAIGGVTSSEMLKKVTATLASKGASKLLSSNGYEVVGTIPVGSMFAFVQDRSIRSLSELRYKKVAVLNKDAQIEMFAELSEASIVDVTLDTVSDTFNQGIADVVILPAIAYDTFELNKGLGKTGGIINQVMYYGLLEIVARQDSFEPGIGDTMRQYMLQRLNVALSIIEDAEKSIPDWYWLTPKDDTDERLAEFYKDIRLYLKFEEQFDSRALFLLWRVRCATEPKLAECEMPKARRTASR